MRIAVIGAMEEEVNGIKEILATYDHHASFETIAGRDFFCFKVKHHTVYVVFSRWGKVASAITASILIDHFKVEAIVFSGVAGAAHPALSVGDVVTGDRYIQHDMDVSPIPGIKRFQIPLTDIQYLNAHKELESLAFKSSVEALKNEKTLTFLRLQGINSSPQVCRGTLASGDQFIADKGVIAHLAEEVDNLYAVDMESAAVAHVCYDFSVPYVAIRVISDKADGEAHIAFPQFIKELASPMDAKIIECLVENLPEAL